MTLFVKENCKFCEGLPDVKALVILRVIETDEGPKIKVPAFEQLIDLPPDLPGLPTLIDGANVYVGKDPIMKKLTELEAAA